MKMVEIIMLAIMAACLFVAQAAEKGPCICSGVQKPYLGDICNCGCVKEVDKGDYIQSGWDDYLKQCNVTWLEEMTASFKTLTEEEKKKEAEGEEINYEDRDVFKKTDGKKTDLWKRCGDMLDSIIDDCENCGTNCTIFSNKKEEDDGAKKEDDGAKKDDVKKEDPKKEDPKKEDPKKEDPKKEDPKTEDAKKEEDGEKKEEDDDDIEEKQKQLEEEQKALKEKAEKEREEKEEKEKEEKEKAEEEREEKKKAEEEKAEKEREAKEGGND